ncbi:MAG: enolase C-terminal domain-like protein [Casimicrobiaceae bacterium]
MSAPVFRVISIELYERNVRLRLPFRFGAATLTACPQAFVRVRIAFADGRSALGASAELLVPKWFDKAPNRSNADNIVDLRRALAFATEAYTGHGKALTAFGHFSAHYDALFTAGAAAGQNALTVNFGPALIDRAILDALCHALDVSFERAVRANLPGIGASQTPDLAGFDLAAFLGGLTTSTTIAARHTVGIVDPITRADVMTGVDDGLPETLEEVIASYGNRHFKLKLGGDPETDIARLARIAGVLDRLPRYFVTLDGNEQYADVAAVVGFCRRLATTPALARLAASTLFLEQPLPRATALGVDVTELARGRPLLIDESDATLDAFPAARARGYSGVSSKSCKGVYKSLLNAARCARWNAENGAHRYFLSAEDLTMQAGLAVQQDLALVALLGLRHVERNGHHYVNGFVGAGADAAEQQRGLAAYPSLYVRAHGGVRLSIRDGMINLRGLDTPGFASAAAPDWSTLKPFVSPFADLAQTGSATS